MGRSSKAEVMRRVAEVFPLIVDCFSLREIRATTLQKTDWGASVSEGQLKRYCAMAREQLKQAARYDAEQEVGAAKRRLERVIARSSARGEMRTLLNANKQLSELLGLPAPRRTEISGLTGAPVTVLVEYVDTPLPGDQKEGSGDAET